MNSPEDNDRDLKAHFANLREEDRGRAPTFGRTVAAVPRRAFHWRIAFAAAPVLAVAVMLAVRTHRPADAAPRQLAVWSSPTAFLLETPGRQLLNQTPQFGGPLIHALPAAQDEPK